MRDDFTEEVKRTLAQRVNYFCSNPDCRAQTTGPQDDPTKAVNVGVAAHITAASTGGPRYNPALSPDGRRHSDNGIWLCQNCAKLIDSDLLRYSEALLRAWRTIAEDRARGSLGKTATPSRTTEEAPLPKLELSLSEENCNPQRDTYSHDPIRKFVLGLRNGGRRTAKFPTIRFRRSCGLVADIFGIDGSYHFGLPRSASENEWEIFRGGVDHVINPGETLNITKLIQRGIKIADSVGNDGQPITLWNFDAVIFECEISSEGVPMDSVKEDVPAHQRARWYRY